MGKGCYIGKTQTSTKSLNYTGVRGKGQQGCKRLYVPKVHKGQDLTQNVVKGTL